MNRPLYIRGMTLRLRRRPQHLPPTMTVCHIFSQPDPCRGWRYVCAYDAGGVDRLLVWNETDLEVVL